MTACHCFASVIASVMVFWYAGRRMGGLPHRFHCKHAIETLRAITALEQIPSFVVVVPFQSFAGKHHNQALP
jgi:hypothetical protein